MIDTNSALAKPFAVASKNNTARYNLTKFVCNTENDIIGVPTTVAPGSTLFCIESSNTYMLNTNREWVKISVNNAGGGGSESAIPEEAFTLSGDISYMFYGDNWNWFLETYGKKLVLSDITNLNSTFKNCNLSDLKIDHIKVSNGCIVSGAFDFAKLKKLPKIIGVIGQNDGTAFSDLQLIEGDLDENYFDEMFFARSSNSVTRGFFSGWYRIQSTPVSFLSGAYPSISDYGAYTMMFSNNYCRKKLENVPIPFTAKWTSNAFSSFVSKCSKLQKMTFESGKTVKWKSQTLDFTTVGYSPNLASANVLKEIYGESKEITDAATYASLKNDTDAWTDDINYSLYNHDSAVETINSLPDTSAYLATTSGTNTIKFKGAAGSLTDGGAISTLTETEIAVATAKGWTVSIV